MSGRDKNGGRYSWVYWAAIVAAFAFLIVDIFDDSSIWNYVVILCVIVAIAVRPGGLRGPRAAAAADDAAAGDAASADETAPHGT
jgi:asparagine N-glycosylation enzyme membrane subunit Stt3